MLILINRFLEAEGKDKADKNMMKNQEEKVHSEEHNGYLKKTILSIFDE